jgi:uncharacterized phage-associated protein
MLEGILSQLACLPLYWHTIPRSATPPFAEPPSMMKHIAFPALHERMVQICVHLARRSEIIDKTKLMKLVYLADRVALQKLEHPISYDDYRKLKNGPAASDIECGLFHSDRSAVWSDALNFVSAQTVSVKDPSYPNDLLSEAELEILEGVLHVYGHLSKREIIQLVHDLPEWESAQYRDRTQITYDDILDRMGISKRKRRVILEGIAAKRAMAVMSAERAPVGSVPSPECAE